MKRIHTHLIPIGKGVSISASSFFFRPSPRPFNHAPDSIRMSYSPEVVRGACLDGSTKVRDSFIRQDIQLTGQIAPFKVSACFKAAGLKFEDEDAVIRKFLTGERKFNYLSFCADLEKKTKSYSSLGYAPKSLPVNSEASSLPPLLRVASSHGSLASMMRSSSSKSMLLRPPHPQGFAMPAHGPAPPRGYSMTASLRPGAPGMRSNGMLRSSSGAMLAQQSQSRLARLHKMASAAELRAAKYSEANQSKMEAADKAAAWRASMPQRRMAADAAREMQANEMEAMAAPVDIAHVDPLVNHKAVDRQKLRSTQFVKGASEALNSRFSDMFKAFQYVDLDRSGTLNKAELTRAIEMWNLPVDSDQLDDLIAACDADGDGNVDYKEFVDVLARDTVAPAAMGKRDMQAMQAMGAADVDPTFLGHGAKVKHAYATKK